MAVQVIRYLIARKSALALATLVNSAAADVIDEIGIGSSEVCGLRNPSAIVRALFLSAHHMVILTMIRK